MSRWGNQIKNRRQAEEARRATGDAAGRGRGGRLSARRKRETVLRLLRGEDLESVSRELGISTRRAYGVQRVCRVWRRARSSVYARRQATTSRAPCRRRGPGVGHAHGPKAHDGTITTAAPDVMWGTDMTATVTVGEGAAFVFVAVDHCTTECIGLHAAKRGTRFEALEPIRQGVRARFGTIGEGVARGLRLRHDHGSNYLADDFQQEVAFFGIESSPSFVREPEGNGVAERFIRTLKENLLWVRSFDTIEELRLGRRPAFR